MSEIPKWAMKWIDTICPGCEAEYRWEDERVKCDCSIIRLGVIE